MNCCKMYFGHVPWWNVTISINFHFLQSPLKACSLLHNSCTMYSTSCLESSWLQARIFCVMWTQNVISKLQNSCGAFLEWAFSLMDHNTGNRNHKEGTLATLPTTITLQTYGKRVGNGEGLLLQLLKHTLINWPNSKCTKTLVPRL